MKYIHVITETKTPDRLSASWTSPFQDFDSDPNVGGFGPTERTMWLPVDEPTQPVYNEVLQSIAATYSPDTAGRNVRGEYIAGEELWRFTWTLSNNDLATARAVKMNKLAQDKATALDTGYTVGNFTFPFTEDFFRQLADRHYWLDIAINDGEVPVGSHITFSDRAGKEVSVTLSQLRTNFRQYGSEYLRIFEIEVDARDAVNAAATPSAVDAVTWSFAP